MWSVRSLGLATLIGRPMTGFTDPPGGDGWRRPPLRGSFPHAPIPISTCCCSPSCSPPILSSIALRDLRSSSCQHNVGSNTVNVFRFRSIAERDGCWGSRLVDPVRLHLFYPI
ncbi:hypothetical protein DFJ73DRAFT_837482, partial [Zopfochytrium polystomum]